MLDSSFAKARTLGRWPQWVVVLTLAACSKKAASGAADAGPETGDSAGARGSGAAQTKSACRAPGKGTSFTLGTDTERAEAGDADGVAEQELPFSVSIGSAVVREGAFLVTAIDQRGNETHAVLAHIAPTVDRGTVLDLGRVFGDAEPPRLALLGERGVVAVPDADAGGRVMKIGLVSRLANSVEWIDSVAQGGDDSPVFSLAVNAQAAVLAWDELESKSRRGFVRWMRLETGTSPKGDAKGKPKGDAKGKPTEAQRRIDTRMSPSDLDAEAPQLVVRPGGFWLGFLSSEEREPAVSVKQKPSKSRDLSSEQSEDRAFVELGKRGVQLLALDAEGASSGRPIAVTEPGAHVETFEMKPLVDGGVLVAYREARRAPGVEEDEAVIVEVRPDGGAVRLRVEDERMGAGVPLLLMPEETKSSASVWLGITGKAGDMNVAAYRLGSGRIGALVGEPALMGAEPVARDGQALLVARPRGKVVEFERLECDFDEKVVPLGEVKLP